MADQPVPGSRLCEQLWEDPSDPRAELRWSLSKLRSLFEIKTQGDNVALDLAGWTVDAHELARSPIGR